MTIPSLVLDDVIAHTEESMPNECCGVLLGAGDRIVASVRANNLSDSPVRFLLDPKDHIGAIRRGRAEGLEVLGFYHSHPHSRPLPSQTDIEEGAYLECVHLIATGLKEEEPRVRLFRMQVDRVEELPLAVLGETASG